MKKLWDDIDKPLFFTTLIFFIYGALNIITSSSSEALNNGHSIYYYFIRQIVILGIGYFIGLIIMRIPSKKWFSLANILYFIVLVVLAYLALDGTAHRGANNWFSLFGIRVQPSEFMKPILIVLISSMLEKKRGILSDPNTRHDLALAWICFLAGAPAILIFVANDFGSMFIVFLIFCAIYFSSYISKIDKWKTLALGIIIIVVAVGFMYITRGKVLSDAQTSRFNFINPCSRYENGGYQVCNGFIAINNGGLFGVGIGNSRQKYSYIPEAHTDSVFAIIVEEYGLIFATVIFFVYIYIIYRILKISKEATTLRGRYIALGVAVYIMSHIIINLGGLFGAMPLTGVPLPFLSYGGSFALSLSISLCMVERIAIETKREKIKIK